MPYEKSENTAGKKVSKLFYESGVRFCCKKLVPDFISRRTFSGGWLEPFALIFAIGGVSLGLLYGQKANARFVGCGRCTRRPKPLSSTYQDCRGDGELKDVFMV